MDNDKRKDIQASDEAKKPRRKTAAKPKLRHTGSLAFGAAALGVVTASVGIVTPPAHADEYPSWSDVQQAKKNVTKQQALVDKITGLIGDLQDQVDQANVIAAKAAESYFQAKDALEAATKKATALRKQADAAAKKAKVSQMRAGLMASHLARTGGQSPSVDLLLKGDNSDAADKLLYQLGTMSKLTEQSQGIYEQATTDKNAAQQLTDQAKVAQTERTKLEGQAKTALQAAQFAQQAVQGALATQQKKSTELVAQLASLKNTSVEKQKQYLVGEQKRKAEAAAARAAAEAKRRAEEAAQRQNNSGGGSNGNSGGSSGSSHSGGSHSGGSGGGSTAPKPPNSNAVGTAIWFAKQQLGKPYDLGGEGPRTFDCSGLTMMAYRAAGINIGSHSVNNQWYTAAARGQIVSYANRQAGDLIFWGSGPGSFYHIGLYIGGGMMVAAPDYGDVVKIQPVWGVPYWQVARPSS